MSYTTLYKVPKKGEIECYQEFRNAFRGGYLIWDNLANEFLGKGASAFMLTDMQPIWDLARRAEIPEAYRITLMTTFDNVMVKRRNIPLLIKAFEKYCADFDDPGHIPAQIEALKNVATEKDCFAVCWTQTSVSGDSWRVPDECDETRTYDVSRDSGHWFLFEEIF